MQKLAVPGLVHPELRTLLSSKPRWLIYTVVHMVTVKDLDKEPYVNNSLSSNAPPGQDGLIEKLLE